MADTTKIKILKELVTAENDPYISVKGEEGNLTNSGILTWNSLEKQLTDGGFTFQDIFCFLHYLFNETIHVFPGGLATITDVDGQDTASYIPNVDAVNKTILIPSSVTSIDHEAFKNKSKIKKIFIPNSVTAIGDRAFSGCSSLENDIKWERNNKIYDSSFNILPEGLLSLGEQAFENCTSLSAIKIPRSLTMRIGNAAFSDCPNLTSVKWDSMLAIPQETFKNCNILNDVVIDDSVTAIGVRAFSKCGLNYINMPQSLVFINTGAFENNSFNSLNFPSYVRKIGAYAFARGAESDIEILYDSVPWPDEQEYANNIYGLFFSDNAQLTEIGDYAFANSLCAADYVELPYTISKLGTGVFRNCQHLKGISFGNEFTSADCKLDSIPEEAFYKCSKLTAVSLPEELREIDNYAFYCCSNLSEIAIPVFVQKIGAYAFSGGSNAEITEGTATAAPKISKLSIPSCASIETGAFKYCRQLQEVTINDAIIPDSGYTEIGIEAFAECANLERCYISEYCSAIHYGAFKNCPNLKNVYIPSSVKYIEVGAFEGSENGYNGPDFIYYDGTKAAWKNIQIGIDYENDLGNFHRIFGSSTVPFSFTVHCSDGIYVYHP